MSSLYKTCQNSWQQQLTDKKPKEAYSRVKEKVDTNWLTFSRLAKQGHKIP